MPPLLRHRRHVIATGLSITLQASAVTSAVAQSAAADDSAHVRAIDSLVRAELQSTAAPGAQVAVAWRGRMLLDRGYGYANVLKKTPVTPATRFAVGSITKTFTAAVFLQEVAAGRMGLDSAIAPYFPRRVIDRRVTLQHLLTHTSGIRRYEDLIPNVAKFARTPVKPDTVLAFVSRAPLEFDPGIRWGYSNTNFHLLGLALERATGKRYFDLISTRITQPLGLAATGACGAVSSASYASGYERDEGKLRKMTPINVNFSFSAGGLCATASDLVRWLQLLPSAVNANHYSTMTAPVVLPSGERLSYGYGLTLGELGGHAWIGHGGAMPGFNGFIAHYPNDSLTITVLANGHPFDTEELQKRIARHLVAIPLVVARDVPLTSEQRRRYVGVYTVSGRSFRVVEEGEHLRVLGPETFTLLYQGEDTFVTREDADIRVQFISVDNVVTGMISYAASGRRFALEKQR